MIETSATELSNPTMITIMVSVIVMFAFIIQATMGVLIKNVFNTLKELNETMKKLEISFTAERASIEGIKDNQKTQDRRLDYLGLLLDKHELQIGIIKERIKGRRNRNEEDSDN